MAQAQLKSLDDLVKHVGRYPEEAFVFVREGLPYATEQMHGAETPLHRELHEYMSTHQCDWGELAAKYFAGALPEPISMAIVEAGGWEKMNRHVSGRELCWGLRDYAQRRWGLMARCVLESWNIRHTSDFGRVVFGFIDFDLMQKQSGDAIEDFEDQFDFEQAFDVAYRNALKSAPVESESAE